jgi:probable phosphoglycerate mutase
LSDAPHFPQSRFRLPAGATDVLLIRHGESAPMPADDTFERNAAGQADPRLSEEGRAQAELLARRLGDPEAAVGIDAIYVSSLRRTAETAAPLVARLGLTPKVDADLREIFLGEWEGGTFRRLVAEKDPRMRRLWHEGRWDVVPGAESGEAFAARVRAALERVQAAHPDQRVAVVCHGGVIGQAIALAAGASPLAFMQCDNSSVTQLVLHGPLWIVRRFNDTAHLGPAFTRTSAPPT